MRSRRISDSSAVLVVISYVINIAASTQLFVALAAPYTVLRMAIGFHMWLIVVVAIAIWYPRKLIWVVPQLITGAAMAHALYWHNLLCPIVAPDFLVPSPGCIVSAG